MSDVDQFREDQRWVQPDFGHAYDGIAVVAEAPSTQEIRQGKNLVGPSGSINWQFAARYARLDRSRVYVTNWRKIPLTDFEKKHLSAEEKEAWSQALRDEIEAVGPRLVIAMGGYAVKALLGSEYSLEWANGLPCRAAIGSLETTVVPVVHPAAGIHQPDLLQYTALGYRGVREYLEAGQVHEWTIPPEVEDHEALFVHSPIHLDDRSPCDCRVGLDTEGSATHPQCITVALHGRAYYVPADQAPRFKAWLEARPQPVRISLQGALHDAAVLRSMGIDVWAYDVVDTQVLAYELQDLPRDLKGLGRRLLGTPMEDYDDVVGPWWEEADAEWRYRAAQAAYEQLALVPSLTPKGKPKLSKGQPVFHWEGPAVPLSLTRHLQRGHQLKLTEVVWAEARVGPRPGKSLTLVPEPQARAYAGKDAWVTEAIEPILTQRIEVEGLAGVRDLDHAVLPLIDDMQDCGLYLDLEKYWTILGEISTRKEEVIHQIRKVTGIPDFNPGSSDQVAEFCRDTWKREQKLGLTKRTKSGMRDSTDSSVLVQLRDEHPFIDLELEFRELLKYETTYLLPLGQHLVPDRDNVGCARLPVHLRETNVVSGRLSAHKPNVLAWPSRTKLGLRLRGIFVAPPGTWLASWDLSQIELRITAARSGDRVMIDAFQQGLDLHTNLASKLFGVGYDRAREGRFRTPAKNIHYALLYGGGGNRVWEMLREAGDKSYTVDECHRLVAETWRVYTGARVYLQGAAREARLKGFVSTTLGRRRYLPGAQLTGDRWPEKSLRLEAERQAGNFKIQGDAADLVKQAMVRVLHEVYPRCRAAGIHLRLWLQIHDELMGEVVADEAAWEQVNGWMVAAMTAADLGPVKVETSSNRGAHWGELK